MNQTEIVEVVREAIMISIQLGMPVMMVGLVVGLIIALLQALTQVQELTLVFVPKIVAMLLTIFVLFPGFVAILITFTQTLADRMIGLN